VRDLYFEHLCAMIGSKKAGAYSRLLLMFHDRPFYEIIPNDANRVIEGQALRDTFRGRHGVRMDDDSCTFLEMLIALAQRMNDVVYEPNTPDQTEKWFWIFVDNLGMTDDTDELMDAVRFEEVRRAVIRVVERTYRRNGSGGIFPVRGFKGDMRTIELWYQMQHWLTPRETHTL
jgi:hypothetical protein